MTKKEPSLALLIFYYTIFRVILVIALMALIYFTALAAHVHVPLVIALLFALIIAAPLSLLFDKRLRTQLTTRLARRAARRKTERVKLTEQLRTLDGQSGALPKTAAAQHTQDGTTSSIDKHNER